MKVQVDGTMFEGSIGHINSMADLVEFVKAQIDPDSIIVALTMNGKELSEIDWRVPLSVHGDAVLEVGTGDKEAYLSDRFNAAVEYLELITVSFSNARTCFQEGKNVDGNTALAQAVEDFSAFLSWYTTLLSMLPDTSAEESKAFHDRVEVISGTCESLLKQQMYQSWWAIGETLQNDLEPKLGELRENCSHFASLW